ncbi:ribonuclease H-like protein [Obba rivulosa]|uniref:Ribonuclease H-like protein n=1 Tax=Obba rivulosa TaxID=1052685 RepID=A0A8E2DGJ1_9APHY|nr:ribonuclease H-like protein [Obba rivulosa]
MSRGQPKLPRPKPGKTRRIVLPPKPILQEVDPAKYSYKDFKPRPTIVYTRHEQEANDLVETLKGPLGFDMEWPVILRRGRSPEYRKTALVQVCDERIILLVHISQMSRFPAKLREVLEDPAIAKMGVNIQNDGKKLFNDYGVVCSNLVELGVLAHNVDPIFSAMYSRQIVSLERMVHMYVQKVLDKPKVRTSNWALAPLAEDQMEYAANDAHSALMVYKNLLYIAQDNNRILDPSKWSFNISRTYSDIPSPPPASAKPLPSNSVETSKSGGGAGDTSPVRPLVSPRHMKAYELWHHRQLELDDIRVKLRSKSNPLAKSTVVSYVVTALTTDPSLPFDVERLEQFVRLDAYSWKRWQKWIVDRRTALQRAPVATDNEQ